MPAPTPQPTQSPTLAPEVVVGLQVSGMSLQQAQDLSDVFATSIAELAGVSADQVDVQVSEATRRRLASTINVEGTISGLESPAAAESLTADAATAMTGDALAETITEKAAEAGVTVEITVADPVIEVQIPPTPAPTSKPTTAPAPSPTTAPVQSPTAVDDATSPPTMLPTPVPTALPP